MAFLIGQRSKLARRIKLQFLGFISTAAGADTNTLADDHLHFCRMVIAPEAATMVLYNAVYPRWVYDQYREAMAATAESPEWRYPDASLCLGTETQRLLVKAMNLALVSIPYNPNPYYLEELR